MDQRIRPIARATKPVFSGSDDLPDPLVGAPPAGLLTLSALLEARAACHPDRTALTYLHNGTLEAVCLNFGDLACRAGRIANSIAARGLGLRSVRRGRERQARVLLLYPSGLDFAQAFLGVLRAGAVAVPAPHVQGSRAGAARMAAIAADVAPALVLTDRAHLDETQAALGPGIKVLTIEDLLQSAGADARLPDPPGGGDLALIQYTSGSTGTPRGVCVTHAAMMANQRLIAERFGHGRDSVSVSWLPMFHDMGLIGSLLQPIYAGFHGVLMPPVGFLEEPLRWLAAIARYGKPGHTTAGAPNFAYDFCVDRIPLADRASLDLRAWTVAYSGSEPVRARTLDRFAAAFAPYGFRARAFYPCYGMAEATLLIAGGDPATPPRRVSVTEAGQAPREVVSCGATGADHAILIVDPETRVPMPEGETGEIWFAGPSLASGYWNWPEQTAANFAAAPAGRADLRWLRTGDLGFLDRGEVFVTGRIKDVMILKGRNHYPQDIEATVQASHDALRPDGGAAFLIERPDATGRDRQVLVVVHEVTGPALRDLTLSRDVILPQIAGAARAALSRDHGLHLAVMALIRPGQLPRTTSGKIRRRATRDAFLTGDLALLAEDRHGPAFWREAPRTDPVPPPPAAAKRDDPR